MRRTGAVAGAAAALVSYVVVLMDLPSLATSLVSVWVVTVRTVMTAFLKTVLKMSGMASEQDWPLLGRTGVNWTWRMFSARVINPENVLAPSPTKCT